MIVVRNGLDITEDFERYIADVERLRPLWDIIADPNVVRVITGEQSQHFRTKAAIELAVAASEARLAERERCAKICADEAAHYQGLAEHSIEWKYPDTAELQQAERVLRRAAEKIRKG